MRRYKDTVGFIPSHFIGLLGYVEDGAVQVGHDMTKRLPVSCACDIDFGPYSFENRRWQDFRGKLALRRKRKLTADVGQCLPRQILPYRKLRRRRCLVARRRRMFEKFLLDLASMPRNFALIVENAIPGAGKSQD